MSAPPPANYAALRRFLDSPPRTVIADWPAFVHPHAPPADADWPAPCTPEEVGELLGRLPWFQRTLCGLTMMAMLTDWLAATAEEIAVEHVPVLREHLALIESALTGDGDWEAVCGRWTSLVDLDSPAGQLLLAIDNLLTGPALAKFQWPHIFEILYEFVFAANARLDWVEFRARWWARCRCRLAMASAAALPCEWDFSALRAMIVGGGEELRRYDAATIGEKCTDPAIVPLLLDMLGDESRGLRGMAVRALAYHGDAAVSAVPKLVEMLANEPVDWLRESVETTLKEIGPAAIPFVMDLLANGRWHLRVRAAKILGDIGAAVAPHLPAMRQRLATESSARVRTALTTAITAVETATTTPGASTGT